MRAANRETVLVTGGAGFIGSHVVALLLARGHEVVVVDDFSSGRRENLAAHASERRLHVVVADLREDFAAALAGVRPAVVVHLAAQVSVPKSMSDPVADLDINLRASVRVLQWAAGAGARRMVLASSAAVYGEPGQVPVSEDMCDRPLSPYGASKRAAELFLGCLGPTLGIETVCLRPFNVYGPCQDPRSPYSGVVSQFLARARAGEALVVQGDGQQTRDFVFVEDVARGFVAAIDAGGVDGLVANLGSEGRVTIAALAQAVVAVTASGSSIVAGPARVGDILHSQADCQRAHARLGWRAEVALAEGLRRTLLWLG